jgi:hypothetical protein
MTDREVDGARFLTEQDQQIIAEGERFLAEELRKVEGYIAQRRAKGRVALLADHVGVSQGAGDELVAKLNSLLEGRSKEEIDDIIADLSSLIAKVSRLTASQPVEALPVSTVAPAEVVVVQPTADLLEVNPRSDQPDTDAPQTIQAPVRQDETVTAVETETPESTITISNTESLDQTLENEEVLDNEKALNKSTRDFLASIVGNIDEDIVTTDDAERITRFLLGLKGAIKPRGQNGFPYGEAIEGKLKNLSLADIAKAVRRKSPHVGVSLISFREAIKRKNNPEDISRSFHELIATTAASNTESAEETTQTTVNAPVTRPGPMPGPPKAQLTYVATRQPLKGGPLEANVEKPIEQYSDTVLSLSKTLELDEENTRFLSLLLDEHIDSKTKFSSAQKDRIVKTIRDALLKRFSSTLDTNLKLTQGERVALNNILGIEYINNEPNFRTGLTVGEYTHKNGSGPINYDRQDSAMLGFDKLAEALAKPESVSSYS